MGRLRRFHQSGAEACKGLVDGPAGGVDNHSVSFPRFILAILNVRPRHWFESVYRRRPGFNAAAMLDGVAAADFDVGIAGASASGDMLTRGPGRRDWIE